MVVLLLSHVAPSYLRVMDIVVARYLGSRAAIRDVRKFNMSKGLRRNNSSAIRDCMRMLG